MFVDFLVERFREYGAQEAIIWRDTVYSYNWIVQRLSEWTNYLNDHGVVSGTVVALEADFSPNSVALMLALVDRGCIFVPLTTTVRNKKREFLEIAEVEVAMAIDSDDAVTTERTGMVARHEFYQELQHRGHPGLVLFSSGSTGKSKAAVHDFIDLLGKFRVVRPPWRAISFLLYDHIGGVNTLLSMLSNGGCLVTVADRTPDGVLRAVQAHHVELLPTSPTFLNLILLSEAWKRYNLSSLNLVTYGTEPMPESTLKQFHELFPNIRLQQTYGLSEVGILRSKSKSSDSLWVKIGGEGFDTRIVDGILQIKARSAMLGYLNAPSPFTEDGWFNTGDAVEVDGEYLRILGRKSELINVGGEKVYPAEVESVILEMTEVADASVYGERNPITGSIVCARITPTEVLNDEEKKMLIRAVKSFCRERMQSFKVPVKVVVVEREQHGGRFKKMRREDA